MQDSNGVDKFMAKFSQALNRHVDREINPAAWTDIYNRAWEAVDAAIRHERSTVSERDEP